MNVNSIKLVKQVEKQIHIETFLYESDIYHFKI